MSNLPQFISYFTQLYSPIYFSLQVSRDVAILTKLPGPKKMAIYGIERVTPIIASLRHVSAILLKFNFDQRIKIGFKLIDMYFFFCFIIVLHVVQLVTMYLFTVQSKLVTFVHPQHTRLLLSSFPRYIHIVDPI